MYPIKCFICFTVFMIKNFDGVDIEKADKELQNLLEEYSQKYETKLDSVSALIADLEVQNKKEIIEMEMLLNDKINQIPTIIKELEEKCQIIRETIEVIDSQETVDQEIIFNNILELEQKLTQVINQEKLIKDSENWKTVEQGYFI